MFVAVPGLADRARVASIEASSAMEGVIVEDRARDAEIVTGKNPALPGVSDQTIRLALNQLKEAGDVEPDSVGRGATYSKLRPAART